MAGTVLAVRVLISLLNHFLLSPANTVSSLETINSKVPGKYQARTSVRNKTNSATLTLHRAFLKANELLLLMSVLTFTIVITLLKRARVPAAKKALTHTYANAFSPQLPWQQKKPGSHLAQIVAQYQLNILLPAARWLLFH